MNSREVLEEALDGFEGTIQQIGVRTTKIRGREDDVFAASCVMHISRRRR